jgi:AraC family transcriptional regulator
MASRTAPNELASLAQYQEYVPGRLVLESTGDAWHGLELRSHVFGKVQPPTPAPAIPQHTLTFVYSGSMAGARRTGGGSWTEFETPPLDGHVTVRPAGRSTALRWRTERPVRTVSLYLAPERLEEVGLQMGVVPAQVEVRDSLNRADSVLKGIADALREVAAGARPADPLYLQTTLQTLTVRLLRRYTTAAPDEEAKSGALSRPRLRRVERYVRAHLDTKLSLDDLAEAVGISKYHFSRRFKRRTGQSPYQFVIYERVRAARHQLRTSSQPLAQIAFNVGFSSQSHFTRTFKQHVGVTPGAYRAAWR